MVEMRQPSKGLMLTEVVVLGKQDRCLKGSKSIVVKMQRPRRSPQPAKGAVLEKAAMVPEMEHNFHSRKVVASKGAMAHGGCCSRKLDLCLKGSWSVVAGRLLLYLQ